MLIAPFEMRAVELGRSREPDLLVIARENFPLDPDGPDQVIEIVSDEGKRRDDAEKRLAFQPAGIPEYWRLDPRPIRRQTQFPSVDANGVDQPIALDTRGRVHSVVLPGFWLDPTWRWQDPLPAPDTPKPVILAGDRRPGDAAGAE